MSSESGQSDRTGHMSGERWCPLPEGHKGPHEWGGPVGREPGRPGSGQSDRTHGGPSAEEDGRTNEQQMIDGDRLPVPPRWQSDRIPRTAAGRAWMDEPWLQGHRHKFLERILAIEDEASAAPPEPKHTEAPGELCDPDCPHWAWSTERLRRMASPDSGVSRALDVERERWQRFGPEPSLDDFRNDPDAVYAWFKDGLAAAPERRERQP